MRSYGGLDVASPIPADFAVPPAFDHGVVFIWAVSGAIVGVRKGFDFIGVAVVALVSAVGGGMLRDGLFLQRTPLILTDGVYLPLILAATVVVVVATRRFGLLPPQDLTDRLVNVIDALGTPAYAMIGMQLALALKLSLSGVLLVGFINGIGGGLLRDVLVGEVPALFQPGGYAALVVLFACVLFIVLGLGIGMRNQTAALIAIAIGFVVRLLTIRFNLRTTPVLRQRQ
jgi:uncharacterized membrane protein YeiH